MDSQNKLNQGGQHNNMDTGKKMDTALPNETAMVSEGRVDHRRSASVEEISRGQKSGTDVPSKFFRAKRLRGEEDLHSGDSSQDEQPAQKVSAGKSGRGRTTSPALGRDARGRFLKRDITKEQPSLLKPKASLVAAERASKETQAAEEVAKVLHKARKQRPIRSSDASADEADQSPLACDLREQVINHLAVITNVATKSSHLKGTFVKALKNAAEAIKDAVEALSSTTTSVETRKLMVDNKRLKSEVQELRGELTALRADLRKTQETQEIVQASPSTSASLDVELLRRSIIEAVGNMVNARFEDLEDRLLPERRLRPPLAADRRQDAAAKVASYAVAVTAPGTQKATPATPEPTLTSSLPQSSTQQVTKVGKAKGQKRGKEKTLASTLLEPVNVQSHVANESSSEWTVVTRRKPDKAASSPTEKVPVEMKKGKRLPRLRPPRSSAVVIKLQQDAAEKGVTYASILKEAKKNMDLDDLGLQAVRFRTAVTGAKILELPGVDSGEKADKLAEKLRQVVGEGVAKVSRPEKCADLRISGLDDAAEKQEVAEVIAKYGDCPVNSVKVSEIRRNKSGLGTVIISCPVGAANNVLKAGRVLISWSSVRAKLLPQRPLRCFRCLEVGHVGEKCTTGVDRSNACFRCGQLGHVSSQCSATPHCLVCAASGKPAGHKIGSKVCTSTIPETRTRGKGATGIVSQPTCPNGLSAREEGTPMAVN